jgi:hypothetical protein
LFESPFFKRESIRFIDSRVAQSTLDVKDMDASVSSWVDWVVVATLRNGRERGIHGASDGVRLAVRLRTCSEQEVSKLTCVFDIATRLHQFRYSSGFCDLKQQEGQARNSASKDGRLGHQSAAMVPC